jgi:N6-adenosine-specific RNA methylase IME4
VSQLEQLSRAERMLAEVATVEEALNLVDYAAAARDLAKRAKLGAASVNHAMLIRLRAERKLAEMVDEGQKRGAIATPGGDRVSNVRTSNNALVEPSTLDALGVDPVRLHEARKLASLSDEQLTAAAELASNEDRELTRSSLLKEAARIRVPDPAVTPATPDTASGRYRCVVIDPPWPIEKIERDERPNQGQALDYPTMPLDEIERVIGDQLVTVADQDGCHIYLWTTHRFLPASLGLFDAWGVTYQCVMTWRKNVGITPFSWMYDTEHVLFGRLGSLKLERLGLRLSFEAPVAGHSVKPDVFFDRVTAASPGPRLEMFARRPREGFTVWGNEVAG